MSVTVTDTRTTYSNAEVDTGWTGGTSGTTVFAEADNSSIDTLNITTGQVYFTGGAINLSNTLVYVWSNNFALQGLWDATPPPNALMLGDGTDQVSFKMAGINRKVFAHLDAGDGVNADWDCLVLDGSQAAVMDADGLTVELSGGGAFAALDLTNIVDVGSDFTTLSKGLGGGVNVATDIIRYGNDGLRVTAGTTGDRGTFVEIIAEDSSSASGKAHGIIRTLSTGLYSCQGPLNFGVAAATDCFFEDTGRVISFEDRNISDDKYYIKVIGDAGATNLFSLSGCTITTAGPLVQMNFEGGNIDTLLLDGNSFAGLGNSVTFSNSADATGHQVINNVFTGSGQIDPGDVTFTGNTITDTTNFDGAVLLDADGSANWEDLTFNYGDGAGSPINGPGHAIYIPTGATGEYDFTNFTYNGYNVGNEEVDSALFNDSGGVVTINVLGGSSPTVLNGSGSSTIINNPITFSVSNIETDSEVRVYDAPTQNELAGEENQNGEVVVAKVFSGGTGYSVSDILTVVGGTGTAATLTVTAETGGVITAVSITTPGDYSVNPPSPSSVTDAGNSNATFTLTVKGTFTYNYNAAGDIDAYLVVFHLDFKDIRIVDIVLSGTNQNIPVQQAVDRVYSNPSP
jgi:hypothetical protein